MRVKRGFIIDERRKKHPVVEVEILDESDTEYRVKIKSADSLWVNKSDFYWHYNARWDQIRHCIVCGERYILSGDYICYCRKIHQKLPKRCRRCIKGKLTPDNYGVTDNIEAQQKVLENLFFYRPNSDIPKK
jgi:hypothetical protein